jgi:hypothetical protein
MFPMAKGWGCVSKKSKFVGQSFELLPVEERAAQYREMADFALLQAQQIEDAEFRDRYLSMAANWHALAQQLEAGKGDPEIVPGTMPPESDKPLKDPKAL